MPAADKLTPPPLAFAVRMYSERPEWRFYGKVGTAKAKFSYVNYVNQGELWECVDGEWVLRFVTTPGMKAEDLPWRKKK